MCGIAGIYGKGFSGAMDETLAEMLSTLAHRGPDDEGIWISPGGECGLGHKRLSIIDPELGHQPLANEDETIWITFNGCIYNYQDIARDLRQKGHRFRTHSDTEVIVHAYEEWGIECVKRFNGMWAFAVWDSRNKTLFCSRDRIGIKPFYYTWDGQTFTFASEIKAILSAGAVLPKPSEEGLRHYLTYQFCLGEQTLFEGVKKLPAGHNLVLRGGKQPAISCYWDIRFDVDTNDDETYFVDKLNRLLEDSVRLRLRADVPLGAHLSGGLDSTSIVCLTRMLLGSDAPLKTFTGAFSEGKAFDETHYAKLVSKTTETEYLEVYPTCEDFAQSLEKIIYFMDEPAAGPGVFPQYWVSKLAAENVKVVLGGQGGDELFIGYARYLIAYLEECIRGAIENTAHRVRYVATLETIVPSLPGLENYIPMLKNFWREGLFEDPARRYFRLVDRFSDNRAFISPEFPADREGTFEQFRSIFDSHSATAMINRIFNFDLKGHLQSQLHVEDRTSMAWGLESRVPLLDHRLVELMASVPPVTKFKNGQLKYLFRRAVKNLVPGAVLDRKDKMGFPVPLTRWLQSELRDYAGDILLSKRCRERGLFDVAALTGAIDSEQPFGRSLWGALCLELWYRQFMDTDHKAVG